jgi:hypothetical protein
MSSIFGIFSSIITKAKSMFSSSSSSSSSLSEDKFNDFITFLNQKIAELNILSDETITEEQYNNLMDNLNATVMEFSNQIMDEEIVLSFEQRNTLLQKLNTVLDFLKTVSPNKDTRGVTPDSLKEKLENFLTPNSTPQNSQEYGGSKRKSNRKSRKYNRKSRKSYKNKRKSYRKSKK